MQLNEEQKKAVSKSVELKNSMIIGSAGTGKTTIIKSILEQFSGFKACLCAPTGKAAARIKEKTGKFAQTIHRLLGLGEDGVTFHHVDLSDAIVVCDEASMIDSFLMAKLVAANPMKLILIGDNAQLLPVGAGCPFSDLINIFPNLATKLTYCYRNKASVHKASAQIRKGEFPTDGMDDGEIFRFKQSASEAAQNEIIEMYKNGEMDPTKDIVLAAKYGDEGTPCGIDSLNEEIKNIVNPHNDSRQWKIGDRVLNCKNFGPQDWWNGDMGTITAVDTAGICVNVTPDRQREDGDIYISEKKMLKQLKYAWALSVHKSQGSQWRKVVFAVPREHVFMISRSLLYTGVTRAKKECLVIGDRKTVYIGLSKNSKKETCLKLIAEKELLGL